MLLRIKSEVQLNKLIVTFPSLFGRFLVRNYWTGLLIFFRRFFEDNFHPPSHIHNFLIPDLIRMYGLSRYFR
jgi:hypothetical protein